MGGDRLKELVEHLRVTNYEGQVEVDEYDQFDGFVEYDIDGWNEDLYLWSKNQPETVPAIVSNVLKSYEEVTKERYGQAADYGFRQSMSQCMAYNSDGNAFSKLAGFEGACSIECGGRGVMSLIQEPTFPFLDLMESGVFQARPGAAPEKRGSELIVRDFGSFKASGKGSGYVKGGFGGGIPNWLFPTPKSSLGCVCPRGYYPVDTNSNPTMTNGVDCWTKEYGSGHVSLIMSLGHPSKCSSYGMGSLEAHEVSSYELNTGCAAVHIELHEGPNNMCFMGWTMHYSNELNNLYVKQEELWIPNMHAKRLNHHNVHLTPCGGGR